MMAKPHTLPRTMSSTRNALFLLARESAYSKKGLIGKTVKATCEIICYGKEWDKHTKKSLD